MSPNCLDKRIEIPAVRLSVGHVLTASISRDPAGSWSLAIGCVVLVGSDRLPWALGMLGRVAAELSGCWPGSVAWSGCGRLAFGATLTGDLKVSGQPAAEAILRDAARLAGQARDRLSESAAAA